MSPLDRLNNVMSCTNRELLSFQAWPWYCPEPLKFVILLFVDPAEDIGICSNASARVPTVGSNLSCSYHQPHFQGRSSSHHTTRARCSQKAQSFPRPNKMAAKINQKRDSAKEKKSMWFQGCCQFCISGLRAAISAFPDGYLWFWRLSFDSRTSNYMYISSNSSPEPQVYMYVKCEWQLWYRATSSSLNQVSSLVRCNVTKTHLWWFIFTLLMIST